MPAWKAVARDSPKVEESAGSSRNGQTKAPSAAAPDAARTTQASHAILNGVLFIYPQCDAIGRDFEKVQRHLGPGTSIEVAAALVLQVHRRMRVAADDGGKTLLASGAQGIFCHMIVEHPVEQPPALGVFGHVYILKTKHNAQPVEAAEDCNSIIDL